MNRILLSAVALGAMSTSLSAQTFTSNCPAETTAPCTVSNQSMGDNTTSSQADNTTTVSSQAGVSSASNQSGNRIDTTIDTSLQMSGNTATTESGNITANGGSSTSASTGNYLNNHNTNDNRSSVGNTSANNGGMSGFGGSAQAGASNGNMSGFGGHSSASTGAQTNKLDHVGNSHSSSGVGIGDVGNLTDSGNSYSKSGVGIGDVGSNSRATGGSVGNTQATTGPIRNEVGPSTAFNGPTTATNRVGDTSASTGAIRNTNSTGPSSAYTGASNSSASTGPVTATNTNSTGPSKSLSGSNSGGNQIDASDRSVNNSRTSVTFIPTVTQITPSSTVGVGNVIKETLACGPLQSIERTPVSGKFYKVFGEKDVPQGWTEDLRPYTNANGELQMYMEQALPDGSVRLYGHQPIMFTTIVGVSGNKSFNLGGGGGTGWGQAGAGASSANQRMVTTIQLRTCEVGILKPVDKEVIYIEVDPSIIRE